MEEKILPIKNRGYKDIAFYIVLILVLCNTAVATVLLVKLFFYPFGSDVAGNDALNYFISVKNLYPTYASHPALITTYMPLYYILFNVSKSLLQISGNPYSAENAMTYIALFIDICLLYLVSRNIAKTGRKYALLAVLIFYSEFFIFASSAFYEPALFDLMFGLIAMLLINSRLKSSYAYAAVIMATAFFFKQTALVIVLGIIAYYLLNEKRKEAIGFLSVFLLIAIPIVIYINILTDGGFIESTILLPFSEPPLPINILYNWAFVLLGTSFIPLLLFCFKRDTFKKNSLLTIIFIAEIVSSTLSMEKVGATLIYLLVPLAFVCVIGISNLEKFKFKNAILIPSVIVLFSYSSAGVFISQVTINHAYNNPANPEIVSVLKETNGNILVEDPEYALDANKSLVFDPDPVEFIPTGDKLWNDSYLIAEIENHSFAAIEFPLNETANRFSQFPGMMQAINSTYIERYNFSGTYIDVPRSTSNEPNNS